MQNYVRERNRKQRMKEKKMEIKTIFLLINDTHTVRKKKQTFEANIGMSGNIEKGKTTDYTVNFFKILGMPKSILDMVS